MRYSAREGRWYGRHYHRPATLDLYEPGTPDFAERNRQTVTKLPGGLVRVDLGEPVRLSKVTGRTTPLPKPVERTELELEPVAPARPTAPATPAAPPEAGAAFRLSNALDG